MGEVARGALSCQGKVVGVIPGFLTEAEQVLEGLDDLHVVQNMVQRKEMMIELSDAFVVLQAGLVPLKSYLRSGPVITSGRIPSPLFLLISRGSTTAYSHSPTRFVKKSF